MSQAFPIGATVADGTYAITENIRGGPDRGVYRGRNVKAGDARPVLITTGLAQTRPYADLARQLAAKLESVSPLRALGPLEVSEPGDREPPRDCMVEDEPPGDPTSALAPFNRETALTMAARVAAIALASQARGTALEGIRPELIYAQLSEDGQVSISGLVPRAEQFLASARQPSYGVPPLFATLYQAPEILALAPASDRSDVFSLCATLAFWLTGESPFAGDDVIQQMAAIASGQRRRWTGPADLGALIDRGLRSQASKRVSLEKLAAELARPGRR